MPKVVPPMAKTVMRIGIIQRSWPWSFATSRAMPAWMAPVFIVIADEPADDEDEEGDVDGAEEACRSL